MTQQGIVRTAAAFWKFVCVTTSTSTFRQLYEFLWIFLTWLRDWPRTRPCIFIGAFCFRHVAHQKRFITGVGGPACVCVYLFVCPFFARTYLLNEKPGQLVRCWFVAGNVLMNDFFFAREIPKPTPEWHLPHGLNVRRVTL